MKSQSSRNQGFSYYFYLVIEGSGSGSIPLTNGSGSRRPKNILIRIRIRNTDHKIKCVCEYLTPTECRRLKRFHYKEILTTIEVSANGFLMSETSRIFQYFIYYLYIKFSCFSVYDIQYVPREDSFRTTNKVCNFFSFLFCIIRPTFKRINDSIYDEVASF